jgi:PAS domain S-box-containing protein
MDSNKLKCLEVTQQKMLDCFQKITQLVPGVLYQFRLRPDGSACMPYVSDIFRSLFRLDPADVREDASKALMRAHPDDLESLMASIKASAQGMTPWQHEYRLKFDDGTELWVFGNSLPYREVDGSILWNGFITDITGCKQAKKALSQSEAKFRTLYDSTSDAVMLLDDKSFLDCNRATLAIFGCATREEFCSKHPADLSPPEQPCGTDSMTLANSRIVTAMEKGTNHFEWMHRRADTGKVFPADVLLSSMVLDDKTVLQATVRDITELKRAEASIRAEQEIMASRAAVRKLAAHMEGLHEGERKLLAHEVHDELGQVLSVLRMDISLLKDRTGLNNAVMDGIERSMLALVDRAIQGVRNVAGSLSPPLLDMGVIAAIEWQCAKFAEINGIPCTLDVVGDIGDSIPENQSLTLFRIVQESLANVKRHAAATRVGISIATRDGVIELEIRDNGKGFDPGKLAASESFGLLGMRERAISIGGELSVTSSPGQGTTVTLRLHDGSAP